MDTVDKNRARFINDVTAWTGEPEDLYDRSIVRKRIAVMFDEGWSVKDAVSFVECLEELNPYQNEEACNAIMSALLRKYKGRDSPLAFEREQGKVIP